MPEKTIPVILEVAHPFGPHGVKGFAEAPSLATAPAILNAIYDATGVRADTHPSDQETVEIFVVGLVGMTLDVSSRHNVCVLFLVGGISWEEVI